MNLGSLDFYYYIAIGGGVLLIVSVIAYFLPLKKIKVPALVTTGIGAGGVGLMCGMVLMAGFGYETKPPTSKDENTEGVPKEAPKLAGMGMGGAPKGGGGMPKAGGPGGGLGGPKMNFGPSNKTQLTLLVTALDHIADKPVHVKLTEEQRTAILKELDGLGTAEDIKDDDAKAKLEAILKILEPHKATLETVGYRWPGDAGGGGFGKNKDVANPFKDGPPATRLKSLLERLAGKK